MSENEIKCMKKEAFKKYLKAKLFEKATKFLFKIKAKHSKSANLNTFGLQKYLISEKLSTKEKKLLFSLRTRSVNVKTNYKNKYKFNMQCSLCGDPSESESETHLLNCTKILESIDNATEVQNASYKHIFSENIEEQVAITKIFAKVRNLLLKQQSL